MSQTAVRSPFHAGEHAVQSKLGVRDTTEPWGRKVIRSWMPDQHRDFYTSLPFVVAAARDELERPWVTLLAGEPGFVQSPDATTLEFSGGLSSGDALEHSLAAGSELGLLGIELDTRRRNRVNGRIAGTPPGKLIFEVDQAFGNCPQYITERVWHRVESTPIATQATRHTVLTADMQQSIRNADTFFIGSGHRSAAPHESDGMDASHRGGPAGFVTVENERRIVFPDYAGNNHFNTIGNLVVDPRVALLFVDFDTGGLLQLTGRAHIDWDSPAVARHAGAQRLVGIDIDEIVHRPTALPLRFSSPLQAMTALEVIAKQRETDDVVSFYLRPRDGGGASEFRAGQHLPLEVAVSDSDEPLTRTYSLSNGPGQGHYRISVKREAHGLVSRFLHDAIEVGSVLNASQPAGDFVLDESERPVVLISAGIGVTPMVSMLHALTTEQSERPIVFLHGARDGDHHALGAEVRAIAAVNDNVRLHTAYSQPGPADTLHEDYDIAGRINGSVIAKHVPNLDADYFLCGPTAFLAATAESLNELGVDEANVHVEQF